MSIPLIGIPVLNRGDLLARCVNSIDYPAERIVVINNGDDESVQVAIDGLRARRPNVEVVKPPHNLGVAGSWNYFLREYDAPYYLICGSDIQFAPGDLEKIDRFASAHPDEAIMFGNHGYSLFALTRRGVELIGYFDENFYPAYLEDCDHSYRLKLLGARASTVPDIHAIHGEAPHWGSSTILSDATFRERNGITHGNNFAYYRAKWGGINGEEVYPTPFNDPSRSPTEWTLDGERRAANDIWGAGAGRRRQQVRGGGMEKKFTVITPTILRPTLADTCRSIDGQNYDNWQHIVVVDIPPHEIPPEQRELIESVRHPKRSIRFCEASHKNFGNTCRSRAFAEVAGDYVLYMDDDDVYLGEAFAVLNGEISDEVWGVFPVERFGHVFFNLPPRICHTTSNQFFYRPVCPWPDNDNYMADGELIELLRGQHPYLVINSEPLARVTRQGMGLY